ncbi:MAG: hypothetical protein OEX02_15215 [Cyclobacteriaceae bacterium]|nr:hypothetical protein [Cyclobacteriaceae bacterium]
MLKHLYQIIRFNMISTVIIAKTFSARAGFDENTERKLEKLTP